MDRITPYYASLVATEILGREVTGPYMYGLAKRGTIASEKDADGKIWFDGDSFKAWLDRGGKATKDKVDVKDLVAKFR